MSSNSVKDADPAVGEKGRRVGWIILACILALPVFTFADIIFSTHQRIAKYRTNIRPGMTVQELQAFAGKPQSVTSAGERLIGRARAKGSSEIPPLDADTELHFYGRSGLPYYNILVFVNRTRGTVTNVVVEKLW